MVLNIAICNYGICRGSTNFLVCRLLIVGIASVWLAKKFPPIRGNMEMGGAMRFGESISFTRQVWRLLFGHFRGAYSRIRLGRSRSIFRLERRVSRNLEWKRNGKRGHVEETFPLFPQYGGGLMVSVILPRLMISSYSMVCISLIVS